VKQCSTCGLSKEVTEFHRNKYNGDGYQFASKKCRKEHYNKTRDTVLSRVKEWYQQNRERKQSYDSAYRTANKDKYAEYDKKRATLPHRRALANKTTAKRRAGLLRAAPTWNAELTALVLGEAYSLAKTREHVTGFAWHVDHIVPLQGKTVCGLHTWNNIQVIPAVLNRQKSNHYERSV
jgi:hypothetical protein